MAEKHEFGVLLRTSFGEAAVVLSTFLLTIFIGLAEGIAVGSLIGAALYFYRKRQDARDMTPPSTDEFV